MVCNHQWCSSSVVLVPMLLQTIFLSKRQAIDGFLYLIADLDTPALVDVVKVQGSTCEVDSPLNSFVGGGALDCIESRFCSDEGGNYPSRDTDVCPWVSRAGQCLAGRPSGRPSCRGR